MKKNHKFSLTIFKVFLFFLEPEFDFRSLSTHYIIHYFSRYLGALAYTNCPSKPVEVEIRVNLCHINFSRQNICVGMKKLIISGSGWKTKTFRLEKHYLHDSQNITRRKYISQKYKNSQLQSTH